jgi:type IV secretory pathway TrbF-like protein
MKLFSRKELVAVAPAGNGQIEQSPNPYLVARREWNSQVDRAFSSLHVWQLLCLACLLIALASVAGITYFGSQTKFVPYVIEVDKLGEAVAVGPAQLAGPADARVVRASLASFISSARLVTPDLEVQRKAIFCVYGMLKTKDPATTKMNEFLNGAPETSPFVRAAKITVNTDIGSVLPISATSWQVDWQETTRDRDGGLVGKPVHLRAVLEIYILPPNINAREIDIQRNPLGIFVHDYNWQEVP